MSLERLRAIQSEYLEMLRHNSLVQACPPVDQERVRVPRRLLDTDRQLAVMTSRGWKPSVLGEIESLLESVHAF